MTALSYFSPELIKDYSLYGVCFFGTMLVACAVLSIKDFIVSLKKMKHIKKHPTNKQEESPYVLLVEAKDKMMTALRNTQFGKNNYDTLKSGITENAGLYNLYFHFSKNHDIEGKKPYSNEYDVIDKEILEDVKVYENEGNDIASNKATMSYYLDNSQEPIIDYKDLRVKKEDVEKFIKFKLDEDYKRR